MALKRVILIAVLLAIAGFGFVWKTHYQQQTMTISNAKAIFADNENRSINVFFNLENFGAADAILNVSSSAANTALIYTPSNDKTAYIPEGSTPSFSSDGVHIQLKNLDKDYKIDDVIPIMVKFQNAGILRTRAVITQYVNPHEGHEMASTIGLFGLGAICRIQDGEPELKIALTASKNGASWDIKVSTEDFIFTEPTPGLGHTPGYGHGHLYLNGLKLQRLYEQNASIGALPAGKYTVSVTLNSNDHRAYVVNDRPVTASVQISIE